MTISSTEVYEIQPHELMAGLIEVIRDAQRRIGYYEIKEMVGTHLQAASKAVIQKKAKHLSDQEIVALAGKLYTKIMIKSSLQAITVLSDYYAEVGCLKFEDLIAEQHKPTRLARHLRAVGYVRPPNVAAHAIVSGSHPEARAARRILAKWGIRIDDPDNGVFLPRSERFIPHESMPSAVNHAKIHTEEYYVNVTAMLTRARSQSDCRLALRLIAKRLREGTLEY